MKNFLFLFSVTSVLLFPIVSYGQLPTVTAVCGEGRNIDWPKIKIEEDKEASEIGGPGFFFHDCDQSVQPLGATSSLANQGSKNYSIKNINDENPMTAWVEGKSEYGIGESFEIKSAGVNTIYNGYQSSPKSWLENSRVKKFKVYKNNVPLCFLELTDEMGRQSFELPGHNDLDLEKEYIFKFEIVDVYPGTKWKDVAISEINLALCCVSAATLVYAPSNSTGIENINEGVFIYSVNMETGELTNTSVLKINKQRHLSMLKITCGTKELELTANHPIYIKGMGFCSISNYMKRNKINNYEELVEHIEVGVWDEKTEQITFEKLTGVELITGDFETYTISKLAKGTTFISNGFISRVY